LPIKLNLYYFLLAECPPHLPQAKCIGNLCSGESCPSYPDAICVISGCGGCEAVFLNRATGEVIPKFACPLNGEIYIPNFK